MNYLKADQCAFVVLFLFTEWGMPTYVCTYVPSSHPEEYLRSAVLRSVGAVERFSPPSLSGLVTIINLLRGHYGASTYVG